MSENEINIAIAEACGWNRNEGGSWQMAWQDSIGDFHESPPYFTEDLNAMHEAFLTLAYNDQLMFVATLLSIQHCVDLDYFSRIGWGDSPQLVNATARQRAEAFLRTIGKWKESAK